MMPVTLCIHGLYRVADMQFACSMHVSEGLLCTCSPAPSALASGGAEATPLPSAHGLMQRTAGGQVSASRLSRQGDDPDVELGFLDEEQPSPSMIGGVSQPTKDPYAENLSHWEVTL